MRNTKTNSIILCLCVSLTFLWSSCKKDKDVVITPPLDDGSLPSASVSNLTVTQKDNSQVVFSMQVAVFKDSKNMEYQLGKDNFSMDTVKVGGNQFIFTNTATALSGGGSSGSYSALMLLDQSGSISSTDPLDHRLTAAKTFATNLGTGNNAWLWSFASSNFTRYGNAFTGDTTTLLAQIENLRNKEGGGTPLYYSQYNAIQGCVDLGTGANKALLTFTDGEDTYGSYTSKQVSDFAVSKNVKLYNIGLGSSSPASLLQQAIDGRGSFMFARDARQLISLFGNLGKLLDGSARFYNISWRASINGSGAFSNGTFNTNLVIKTPYNQDIIVPLRVVY